MRICCVIPAFNESGNLEELTKRIKQEFMKLRIYGKIIYVLQGETRSIQIIKKLKRKYSNIDYLYFPFPLGVGKAYKLGFQKVGNSYTHVLALDADLNHQPEELKNFLQAYYRSGADIIIGSRFIQGGKSFDRRGWKIIASKSVNKLINYITGVNISDKTSGFRLIKVKLLRKIRESLKETGYPSYLELILLAKQEECKIIEIPITYVPRRWGKSKMGIFTTTIEYLLFISRLLFNSYTPKRAGHPEPSFDKRDVIHHSFF